MLCWCTPFRPFRGRRGGARCTHLEGLCVQAVRHRRQLLLAEVLEDGHAAQHALVPGAPLSHGVHHLRGGGGERDQQQSGRVWWPPRSTLLQRVRRSAVECKSEGRCPPSTGGLGGSNRCRSTGGRGEVPCICHLRPSLASPPAFLIPTPTLSLPLLPSSPTSGRWRAPGPTAHPRSALQQAQEGREGARDGRLGGTRATVAHEGPSLSPAKHDAHSATALTRHGGGTRAVVH